jgi:hypothetical protein
LIVVIERFHITLSTIADEYEAELSGPRGKLRINLDYASIASRQKIGCGQKNEGTTVIGVSG